MCVMCVMDRQCADRDENTRNFPRPPRRERLATRFGLAGAVACFSIRVAVSECPALSALYEFLFTCIIRGVTLG